MPRSCTFDRLEYYEYEALEAVEPSYKGQLEGIIDGVYLANKRMRYLLALDEQDRSLHGIAAFLSSEDTQLAELKSLFVEPYARGRGIGSELLEQFEQATAHLLKELRVLPDNTPAINMYKKFGYVQVEYRGSGIIMRK